MKFQIGAMTVGDILDRGLKLLLARLGTFYAINLIVLSPIIAVQLATPVLGAGLGFLVVPILNLILQPIGTAAILHVISQEFVDQRVGVGDAFRFALSRFGTLLGASIISGFIIGIGLGCILVPGLIFWTWYALVPQVVVVEGLGVTASLNRSKQLGEGFRWRIFGIICLVLTLMVIILVALALLLGQVFPQNEVVPVAGGGIRFVLNYRNYAIDTVITELVIILMGTFQAVCLTLLYFDLRIRKEGFDLEMAAFQQQTSQKHE
jgi:hypothetical protein